MKGGENMAERDELFEFVGGEVLGRLENFLDGSNLLAQRRKDFLGSEASTLSLSLNFGEGICVTISQSQDHFSSEPPEVEMVNGAGRRVKAIYWGPQNWEIE